MAGGERMTGKDYGAAEQIREDKPDASPNLLMGTEFNLSEELNIGTPGETIPKWDKEKVKEFIKRLKGLGRDLDFKEGKVFFITEKELDELAGEKLI